MGTYSRSADRLPIAGPPNEKFAIQSYTAHFFRPNKTEFITPRPQQMLSSWAEFMAEEPVKPKGRGRKPQPATLSMFEWALTLEQEREGEPVGAGR